jgi:hypothetical protein
MSLHLRRMRMRMRNRSRMRMRREVLTNQVNPQHLLQLEGRQLLRNRGRLPLLSRNEAKSKVSSHDISVIVCFLNYALLQ